MATNHRRMTCKEALKARYKVTGKVTGKRGETRYSECAVSLSFDEAQRYFDSLTYRGFSVKVVAYWDEHVFYSNDVNEVLK